MSSSASTMDTSSVAILGTFIGSMVLLAGQFDNHLWRIICVGLSQQILPWLTAYSSQPWYARWSLSLWINAAMWCIPHLRFRHKRAGCVFVTGADSGMGQATVLHLAETNDSKSSNGSYDCIFAAAFQAKEARAKLEELIQDKDKMKYIQVVSLDVTKDETVQQAAATVKTYLQENKSFLSGLICYHGIAFNGPLSYIPISIYQTQMDVNFFGNIRICQAFLPLLRSTQNTTSKFRRLIFTGTGGGPCSPCPPLLTSYMSSKFAVEASAQALKQELYMTQAEGEPTIDVSVINPGFVKPTQLMAEGMKLTEKMWKMCEDKLGSSIAKDQYGKMMDHFVAYSEAQPGTHVSLVSQAAEHALTAYAPRSSYKVGIDSKLAPIVGMLPTGVREWIARHGIYGVLSPVTSNHGYRM